MELLTKSVKNIQLATLVVVLALSLCACKMKPGAHGSSSSSATSTFKSNSNGISLVAGESAVSGSGKALLFAAVRDNAVVVAFCPNDIRTCSKGDIRAFPGQLVIASAANVIFSSVMEFDLKSTKKFSVFARMGGGGLVCGDFVSETSKFGPVVVSALGQGATLCAGSDPDALGNGFLRQLLKGEAGAQPDATPKIVTARSTVIADWVPNPERLSLSDMETELIRRTNETRATVGLEPLLVSSQLMQFARSWAQSVASRMAANEHSNYGVSENACCSPPGAFSAQEAFGIWQYSPEAKDKMMAREPRYIGVGGAVDAYGNNYWYQLFL